MTWPAPIEATISTFAVLHTPVTLAPNAVASCTANVPTSPAAPLASTRCPGLDLPLVPQRLQRGDPRHRHRRRLLERQAGRLWSATASWRMLMYLARVPRPSRPPNTSLPGRNSVTFRPPPPPTLPCQRPAWWRRPGTATAPP